MAQNRVDGGDIAMLAAVAVAGFIAFRVMDGIGSVAEIPMTAANEALGVVGAGTDAVEAAFSVPETIFSGTSQGLGAVGNALGDAGNSIGNATGSTFDFATDIPGNVGNTVSNFEAPEISTPDISLPSVNTPW